MTTGSGNSRYTLHGSPSSLYTGKVRSYLRKQQINFVEAHPSSDRYTANVVPVVGRWIIPVLQTPDGRLIQDGADIIDHFERGATATRYPAYPTTPRHLAVSHVFELFGGEGLLRPAMHYRWNFNDQNRAFLEDEFTTSLFPPMPAEQAAAFFLHSSGRMRKAAVNFGVNADTAPFIEDAFIEWLQLFDAHLGVSPYLLGGVPTLGDYGLMAAMWAHLFRDPAPAILVKQRAPRVGRWVERMSTYEPYDGEYPEAGAASPQLFADDSIPPTLTALMRYVSEEYLPEITAHVQHANTWLSDRPDLVTGTNGLPDPASRGIGRVDFTWRGMPISTNVMPYRFWLMQRLHDAVAQQDANGQAAVRATLAEAGLDSLLDLRTARRVERVNHLEVWGPLAAQS